MGQPLAVQLPPDREIIVIGDLLVYPEDYVAELAGERLALTNKEFKLLVLFVRNPGRLLRRDLIAAEVWEGEHRGRTIDIHVARLRSRLPKDSIETVVRVGYRFVLG